MAKTESKALIPYTNHSALSLKKIWHAFENRAANPLYAWNNVSWTLSFLAFIGVIVVSPIVVSRLYRHRQPKLVESIIIESLCAELLTAPYILLIFGQISLISVVANVFVAAWIPLAMILCMVAGVAGVMAPAIVGWLAWPATVLLTYMLDVARILSRMPHAFMQNIMLSGWCAAMCYTCLGMVSFTIWYKARKNATLTDIETPPG